MISEDISSQAKEAIKSISASHFLTSGTLFLFSDKIEFVGNNTTSISFCDVADVYLDKELIILRLTNDNEYFFDVHPESSMQEWVDSIKLQWQRANGINGAEDNEPPLPDDEILPLLDDEDDEILPLLDDDEILPLLDDDEILPLLDDDEILPLLDDEDLIQQKMKSSETLKDLKTDAMKKIKKFSRKVEKVSDAKSQTVVSSNKVSYIDKFLSKKSNVYILCIIVIVAFIIMVLLIPFIRWLLFIGALAWLGFSFYKKSNKVLPIIASVITLSLVLFIPSGGNVSNNAAQTGTNTGSTSSGTSSATASGDAITADTITAYFERVHDNVLAVPINGPVNMMLTINSEYGPVFGFNVQVTTLGSGTFVYVVDADDGRIIELVNGEVYVHVGNMR